MSTVKSPWVGEKFPKTIPKKTLKQRIKTYIDKPFQHKYQSLFFRKDILDSFSQSLIDTIPESQKSTHTMTGPISYKLYNIDDIIDSIRSISTEKNYNANIKLFMDKCSEKICKNIGSKYSKLTINDVFNNNKFDLAILSIPFDKDDSISKMIDGVVGFIVTELGECNLYPNAYSIKLVCTTLPGIGTILMGLYLYAIVFHPKIEDSKNKLTAKIPTHHVKQGDKFISKLIPIQHVAVLELAGGYTNITGLCLYEKFGFIQDTTMNVPRCFSDIRNLPMIIKFDERYGTDTENTKFIIIDIVAGTDKGFEKDTLCSIRPQSDQVLLSYLLYIKRAIELRMDMGDLDNLSKALYDHFVILVDYFKSLPENQHHIDTINIDDCIQTYIDVLLNKPDIKHTIYNPSDDITEAFKLGLLNIINPPPSSSGHHP